MDLKSIIEGEVKKLKSQLDSNHRDINHLMYLVNEREKDRKNAIAEQNKEVEEEILQLNMNAFEKIKEIRVEQERIANRYQGLCSVYHGTGDLATKKYIVAEMLYNYEAEEEYNVCSILRDTLNSMN